MPPAARLTDMHTCPMQTPAWPSPIPHVGGPIVGPGAATVLIGKLPAAVMGREISSDSSGQGRQKHRSDRLGAGRRYLAWQMGRLQSWC